MTRQIPCPCGRSAHKTTGRMVYPHRPDLARRVFYLCNRCGRYVGAHARTEVAFGVPADEETRRLRQLAHEEFDPIWRSGPWTRKKAYRWLARRMGRPEIHIGELDAEDCRRILLILGRPLEVETGRSSRGRPPWFNASEILHGDPPDFELDWWGSDC